MNTVLFSWLSAEASWEQTAVYVHPTQIYRNNGDYQLAACTMNTIFKTIKRGFILPVITNIDKHLFYLTRATTIMFNKDIHFKLISSASVDR